MSGFWLPAVPLLAALVGFATLRLGSEFAARLAGLGGAAASVLAVIAMLGSPWLSPVSTDLATVSTGGPPIQLAARLDGLAAVIAVMVTVVALLVQVYSVEYLRGDPRYPTYAAFVSLFTAAMLLVVVADDLVVLLVGWEVMGLCSYALIGHHRELPEARAAALKAFLTTRLGDAFFLVGIIVYGWTFGTFQISGTLAVLSHPTASGDPRRLTVIALLLACGVIGKSAQFPLHVWLPDAMAGPTPVSALIHAATMVAAGVFAVVRLYPIFLGAPNVLALLGVLSAISMVGAALAALVQDDIKRVLAYGTVSQLAYMMGALACGGRSAAVFHLLVHAAFKALAFLAAGVVIHSVGSNLMSRMGGLRRSLPVTSLTMAIALASGAGLPPLAGFFSKESVLTAANDTAHGHGEGTAATWVGWVVLVAALVTVALTAAYSARLFLRTFAGTARGPETAHEPSLLMRAPLVVLAIPAATLGVIGLSAAWLPTWIGAKPPVALTPALTTSVLSVGLALVSGLAVWAAWRRDPAVDPALLLGRIQEPLRAAFYVDQAYDRVLIRPLKALSAAVVTFDDRGIGAVVQGAGAGTVAASTGLRRFQRGNAQTYVGVAVTGVVLVVALAAAAVLG